MKASPKIEKEMIESCKAGDQRAFSEIVLQRQKKVFNMAYRMLGNLEEAKDLAQEVFISVFESIKGLKEEIKFDAWLTQVTLNHCRNRWKYKNIFDPICQVHFGFFGFCLYLDIGRPAHGQ